MEKGNVFSSKGYGEPEVKTPGGRTGISEDLFLHKVHADPGAKDPYQLVDCP